MNTCPICLEPSVFDVHPCCEHEPDPWPAYALAEFAERQQVRRCPKCHGLGWTLPTDTRPQCDRCHGKGHTPWNRNR